MSILFRAIIWFFRRQNPPQDSSREYSRREPSEAEKRAIEQDLFDRARSPFMDSMGWYEDNKHLFGEEKP